MKIYSRRGDEGQTSLADGTRISKCDLRMELCGTLDELNAHVGLLMSDVDDALLASALEHVQHVLFQIGACVVADGSLMSIAPTELSWIEAEIDAMQDAQPPLHSFLLPGGCRQASQAHVCRTVCRRAERCFFMVCQQHALPEIIGHYLNRLSDYFFVLARKLNILAHADEKTWCNPCK